MIINLYEILTFKIGENMLNELIKTLNYNDIDYIVKETDNEYKFS